MKKPAQKPWKVIESRYLAREPWFTVRDEQVELPDGRRIPHYYVFEYPDWVNVIARTTEGRFVLVSQYRHGLGRTDYELPAGVVEKSDRTPLATAQRELAEETGYGGGKWRCLMSIAPNPATQNNLTHCFVAEGVETIGERHLDATEDLDVHLFTRDELYELLCTGGIRQALMTAPLWRFAAEQGWAE